MKVTHAPSIAADDGAARVFGAPADGADGYPSDTGYLTTLP